MTICSVKTGVSLLPLVLVSSWSLSCTCSPFSASSFSCALSSLLLSLLLSQLLWLPLSLAPSPLPFPPGLVFQGAFGHTGILVLDCWQANSINDGGNTTTTGLGIAALFSGVRSHSRNAS